jgi:hypothetical protein
MPDVFDRPAHPVAVPLPAEQKPAASALPRFTLVVIANKEDVALVDRSCLVPADAAADACMPALMRQLHEHVTAGMPMVFDLVDLPDEGKAISLSPGRQHCDETTLSHQVGRIEISDIRCVASAEYAALRERLLAARQPADTAHDDPVHVAAP